MMQLDIGIICGPENGSPRVLAETFAAFIRDSGNDAEVFYRAKAFKRLLPSKCVKYNWLLWLLYRIKHLPGDWIFFSRLRKMKAIIICDWTPNGFYNDTYNIEKLKGIINHKPILYYAVQYLLNSPTIVEKLKNGNHASIERYDWHLSVSSVTELRGKPAPPWNQIGMYLKSTGLSPATKQEFIAIVDFVRPGYEQYREIQIRILEVLGISYISLEHSYSLNEIRELYQQAALFFIQFPEAYGLPIAECLSCGTYIFTPESSWPMSWRLDNELEVHGPGTLPDCFVVYDGANSLKKKLEILRKDYDLFKTPKKVFETFYKNYPTFYEGNPESLKEVLKRIEENDFSGVK